MKSAVSTKKRILAIVGPTASGKTEVAFEVSKLLPSEMISCDSMQVYKGMSTITQAPRSGARFPKVHLTSFLNPAKEYSAAQFREEALGLIQRIIKEKKVPILVGGTGLYLRALLDGLFESSHRGVVRDMTFREKLLKEQETHGGDYLHRQLESVDPLSAGKIHPNDFRRLIRALEVFHLTGKPISEQKANRRGIRGEYECRVFFLDRQRNELYERINRRVDHMMNKGLLKEVTGLRNKKISVTAQMALGVREMAQVLNKEISLHEAKELLKRRTRNYAKRQLSWFRHEKDIEMVPVFSQDTAKDIAKVIVKRWKQNDA